MHAVEFSRIGCSRPPVSRPGPSGQLLYLIHPTRPVKSTRREEQNQIRHPVSEATSQAYPTQPTCQIDDPGRQSPTQTHALDPSPQGNPATRNQPLDTRKPVTRRRWVVFATWGVRPSGPPLYRLGRTSNKLRGTRGSGKSGHPPGRVESSIRLPCAGEMPDEQETPLRAMGRRGVSSRCGSAAVRCRGRGRRTAPEPRVRCAARRRGSGRCRRRRHGSRPILRS